MFYQIPDNIFNPLIEILIMLALLVLMIYCFQKFTKAVSFATTTLIMLSSVIFGLVSISLWDLPFTPYIQTFFIVFQSILYLLKINNPI